MADKKPLKQESGKLAEFTSTDTVSITNGGTGASSASAAINALLPSQAGNNTKVLGTNGTNVSWVSGGGGSPAVFDSGNETPISNAVSSNTSGTYKYTYTIGNYPKFSVGDSVTVSGFTTNTGFNITNSVNSITFTAGISRSSTINTVTTTAAQTTYSVTTVFLVTDLIKIEGLTNNIFNKLTGTAPTSVTSTTLVYNNTTGSSYNATLTPGVNTVTLPAGQTTRGLRVGQPVVTVSSTTSNFATGATIATITGAQTFTMSANHTGTAAAIVYFLPSQNATITTANNTNTTNLAIGTCTTTTTTPNTVTISSTSTSNTYSLFVGQRLYQSGGTGAGFPSTTTSTMTVTSITGIKTFTVSVAATSARNNVVLTTLEAVSPSNGRASYDTPNSYTFELNGISPFVPNATTENSTTASGYQGVKYSISSAVANGNYATYTTSVAHGYSLGDSVVIAGITPVSYNGAGIITQIPSTTQFTINNSTASGTTTTSVTGATVLRQGYTTGSIPGNTLYTLAGRRTVRSFKPPAGAWISINSINSTDSSVVNFGTGSAGGGTQSTSINVTSGNNFRWLTLFTVPYDVVVSSAALVISVAGTAGSSAIMGIYKMVSPSYNSGYLLTSNSATIALNTAQTANAVIKSIVFSTPISLVAGDLYGYFIATSVNGGSPGFGVNDINESWGGLGTPTTGGSTADLYASNFGHSFYQQGSPSVISAIASLPNNLDSFSSLFNATVAPTPLVYLKTV